MAPTKVLTEKIAATIRSDSENGKEWPDENGFLLPMPDLKEYTAIEDAAAEVIPGRLLGEWVSEECIDEALDIARCECATDEVERLFVGMGWGGDYDQKNRHDKPRSVAIGSLQYSGLQAVWSSIRACMV